MMNRHGLARSRFAGAGLSGVAAIALMAACCAPESSDAASAPVIGTAASEAEAVVFQNNENRHDSTREFAYNWPAEISAIPELADQLIAERGAALAEQHSDFEEAMREFADSECIACTNRDYAKDWAVVADLPRFLSLSASLYVYGGGAHGNSFFDALVWDREAYEALRLRDFFVSDAAIQQAFGARWCSALQRERVKRLGEEYASDDFFTCPDVADLTLVPASSDNMKFDRMELLAAPYVAGSYVEGSYEITLVFDAKALAAVKPEYRGHFAVAK